MSPLTRRDFLRLSLVTGAAALLWQPSRAQTPAPTAVEPPEVTLARQISATVDNRAIGVDLRRINQDGSEQWRIQVNASQLYPVASCFKTFAILYYCWHMPYLLWSSPDEESPLYQIAVNSANLAVNRLFDDVARRIASPSRNPIELFNDFLLETLSLRNGLHRWRWLAGSGDSGTAPAPTADDFDSRFAPSQTRCVRANGLCYPMDNLFTPADLADGYTLLLADRPFPDVDRSSTAIQVVLDLFSIPAAGYESPIERAFERGYTGKDGVLPAADSAVGRVVNDAGMIQLEQGRYVIAYMCAEGEYAALRALGDIAEALNAYDAARIQGDQAGSS